MDNLLKNKISQSVSKTVRHKFYNTFEQRFWAKVKNPDKINGCMEWTGHIDKWGYGRVSTVSWNNKHTSKAHRVSWELVNEIKLNSDMFVCHRCDNKLCVNPVHLFIGTNTENMHDFWQKVKTNERRFNINKCLCCANCCEHH